MLKKYNTTTNADGSVNIHGLDVFKLGTHKGHTFDDQWFSKALEMFHQEKEQGFSPAAVIGHKEDDRVETPSIGQLDNLTLNQGVVYTDVLNIPADEFGELRKRKYPNRSLEINPDNLQIQALSFLGKTRPYHKLPSLNFAEGDMQLRFSATQSESPIVIEYSEDSTIDNLMKKVDALYNKIFPDNHLDNKDTIMDFKEKHGMTAEEMLEQNQKLNAEVIAFREKANADQVIAFGESLVAKKMAPAVIDKAKVLFTSLQGNTKPITFDETDTTSTDLFSAMLNDVLTLSEKGELVVTEESIIADEKTKGGTALSFEEKLHQEALKIAKEQSISYEEAVQIAAKK
jgi:hypothetical protein